MTQVVRHQNQRPKQTRGHVGSLDLNSANKYYFKVQKLDLYQMFIYELLIVLVLSYNQTIQVMIPVTFLNH